jgi:hypothetical protein
MTRLVRPFLAAEAALFGLAALMHGGILIQRYEHAKASTAESVIAIVLAAGLAATTLWSASSRAIGLWTQGFALFGTMVGLFTIAIGVGPRTAADLVLHAVMIALLVSGLLTVARHHPALTR